MNTVLTENTTHHVPRTPARSPRRSIRAVAVAAAALLLAAAAPAAAQHRPESPFAGASAVGYPDGSRLDARYEQVDGGDELPGLSGRAPDRSAIVFLLGGNGVLHASGLGSVPTSVEKGNGVTS